MVLQNSPSNTSSSSASSILHQFILSDSISNQPHHHHHHHHHHHNNNQFQQFFRPNLRDENDTFLHHHHHHHAPPSSSSLPTINETNDHHQIEQMNHTRHLMDLLGATNNEKLSLSLNNSQMLYNQQHQHQQSLNSINNNSSSNFVEDYSFYSGSSSVTNSSYGSESFVGNSRYLKPAQALLEEIVNGGSKEFGDSVNNGYEKYIGRFSSGTRNALELSNELKELSRSGFFTADKHELQIKISKLGALLQEVENRYEKYYNQMEEVSSSFEMIAGLGSAKTYTSLALQAMSKHFCNLRDAILAQINIAKRKIVHDLPKLSSGLSQLNLFDQENRQNRMSLQQLGLIQSQKQAWRPIRGLPETSVTILRTWLFEHFLHPYPNDSEKLMLASQTGLSKNQVSNWFINARVRLWKPMIEEMYKEEFADSSSMDSDQCVASTSNAMVSADDHSED